jgi:hypothetical protein
MATSSGGTVICPDCGRPCNGIGGLSKRKGKKTSLVNQATNKYPTSNNAATTSEQTATTAATPPAPLGDLSPRLRQLRQSNQLMRRLPKPARYAVAETLIDVLNGIINRGDAAAWERLLTFSFVAFSLPATKEKRTVSLATLVNRNLACTADPLTVRSRPKRPPAKTTTSKLQKTVMGKINDGDVSGAVRLLSSEHAVAAPTAELDALRAKDPPSDPDEIS